MAKADTAVRTSLGNQEKTVRKSDFDRMRRWFPERVTIVAEGDSWFAYPSKWYIDRKPANLIDHISSWTHRKASFYAPAVNGDEAVDMVSGKQKHHLVNVLRWHESRKNVGPVDLLLFSGGGNDIVGENDFERFLEPYTPGDTARDCVRTDRLERKAEQIAFAYHELIDIRDHYSPTTLIMTHTYDYPYPSTDGAVFLGGLISMEAWMKPFMDRSDIGIPEELQCDVLRLFIDTMAEAMLEVARHRSDFVVVDTRNTLKGRNDWLNEIHPDSEGFEDIARKIYDEMTDRWPALR